MHETTISERVLWIGGSPCAGKSTIAGILASRFGLQMYHCDVALESHRSRVHAVSQPTMDRILSASWNDLWTRLLDVQIADEFAFFREQFPMVVADLQELPPASNVIVEGAGLLPDLVEPLLSDPTNAIWIVPTPEFQREHYALRPWVRDVLQECEHPQQAFDTWMARDSGYADAVAESADRLGLRLVRVDGSQTIEEMAVTVATWFRLPSSDYR
ncbi:MAG: hypothetical protein M3439_09645 [Chloroflexota bacterium]|nr:hypothetical protein [Chloroflexota bacterium]